MSDEKKGKPAVPVPARLRLTHDAGKFESTDVLIHAPDGRIVGQVGAITDDVHRAGMKVTLEGTPEEEIYNQMLYALHSQQMQALARSGASFSDEFAPAPARSEQKAHIEQTSLDLIRAERNELFVENQSLKSRVQEEKRRAEEARKDLYRRQSDFDKLLTTHAEHEKTHAELVKTHRELQTVLLAKDSDTLRMHELFYGEVVDVHNDEVIVVFETEDDPIEHVYTRDQFIAEQLPEEGEKVIVGVFLSSLREPSEFDDRKSSAAEEVPPRQRKNVIHGPYSF